jgi:hypothetical protein
MGGAWASPERRPLSADRRIFCRIRGEDYGIGWQCKELNRRSMRATFFCEVLSSLVLGDRDTSSYLDFLLLQNQDVQLHVHPNFYHYERYLSAVQQGLSFDHTVRSDSLSSHSETAQFQLLREACRIFERLTGMPPLAFRAGGYNANRQTLSILAKLGITIDSSFNPCYQGRGSFDSESVQCNLPQLIEGIWEVPITVAIEDLPDPRKPNRYMPLEISALSLGEMTSALDDLQAAGASHIVIVFHSFSAIKSRDIQYSAMRPDRIVQRRFLGLLDYLAQESHRFTVSTIGDLASDLEESMLPKPQCFMPRLGYVKPLMRKATQLLNRVYWI